MAWRPHGTHGTRPHGVRRTYQAGLSGNPFRRSSLMFRCEWAGDDQLMIDYHDREWGVPVHDDQRLFEFLILEGAQAGLSWMTILKKRENYRGAFQEFDPLMVMPLDCSQHQDELLPLKTFFFGFHQEGFLRRHRVLCCLSLFFEE